MTRSVGSFALLVSLAFLVVVSAVQIQHGYVSPINRQTSAHSLSFMADLSTLAPLSNYDVFYGVGVSNQTNEILDWTQLTTPQSVNQVDLTISMVIPDNYDIYINMKTVAKDTGVETNYTSDSLKVGNRLSSDASCDAIFNPVGTSTVTPPQPDVTIEYDNTAQKFHFTIVAKYLLQGYTWIVDFAPFGGNHTLGYKGLAATNCENRVMSELNGRSFASLWNAAPAADYSGALNSENYLSYYLGTASPKWTVASTGCDKVTYTTPGFSFQDLLNCKTSSGSDSIIRAIVDNNIQYNGTLYVTAVKPLDQLDETKGFSATQFTVPFFVSFSVSSTSISSGTDSNIFGFSITSLNIAADGNLAMTMTTNTFATDASLSLPVVSSQPSSVTLGSANTPVASQQQSWSFKTSTPFADYSGPYTIQFTRTQAASTVTVAAQFTLNLKIDNGYGNSGLTFPTTLSFWNTNSFSGGQETNAYTSLDTIYVKSTVNIANNQDKNSYVNSIFNVWLCYTVDDTTPVYNPSSGQLGCSAQTWNIRPISQLVMNGGVLGGALESQFETLVNNSLATQDSINSGVAFKAAPLATLRSGKFFVQIESRINLPATNKRKRALMGDQATSHKIQAFDIVNGVLTPSQPGNTPIASGASRKQLAIVCIIGILSVVFVL
jgi:hypothetical protein